MPVKKLVRPAKRRVVKSSARPATAAAKRVAAPRAKPVTLADGQLWRLGDEQLKVEMVGKLLVHYKLAKPTAIRTPTAIASIATLLKFMKKHKAVLIKG
ncbi:MAG: hypothetical protein RLZZ350_192 [Verrucomicrobiota bacterium]|jgi:hypothetical protein